MTPFLTTSRGVCVCVCNCVLFLQPSNLRTAPVYVPVKQPPAVNLSLFPPHLRTPPPIPHSPHLPQGPVPLKDSISQCQFTEVTQVAPVDLQVSSQHVVSYRTALSNTVTCMLVFCALLQMLDIFEEIPFDNPDGGVWKQGYDISYSMADFDAEPLTVFIVPHSHNDPGKPCPIPSHTVM